MGKILAIDYGTKRVGIAESDDLKIIAFPLTTVHSKDLIEFLQKYSLQNSIEGIVVGEPKRLNNEPTDVSELINQFVVHLKRKFPQVPVYRIDERFTSKIATQAIQQSGLNKKKRQDKSLVDTVSATLILQSFLQNYST